MTDTAPSTDDMLLRAAKRLAREALGHLEAARDGKLSPTEAVLAARGSLEHCLGFLDSVVRVEPEAHGRRRGA